MRHEGWMSVEEKRPSNSVRLARELAAMRAFAPLGVNDQEAMSIVPLTRFLYRWERDLIERALRAYDKDV